MPKSPSKQIVNLPVEGKILSSLMRSWIDTVTGMTEYDFVGAYILATLSLRSPRRYLSSRLLPAVILQYRQTSDTGSGIQMPFSKRISEFPGLLELLDKEFLAKKCAHIEGLTLDNVTVISIFNRCF
jgi:hypothetical protein